MLVNYLLVALFNLRRQPVFSAVKVLSLAIGLGCSMLVIMHVLYAFSFDRHFPNWQNIYRVVTSLTLDKRMHTEFTGDAGARRMLEEYPQIEHTAMILHMRDLATFSTGEFASTDPYVITDSGFIDVFSPTFISGDPATALSEPYSMVLDETSARKYFGNAAALGQTLSMGSFDVKISGVIRDMPKNTHMPFRMLLSTATAHATGRTDFMNRDDWIDLGVNTYITVPDKAAADAINADLPAFLQRNVPDDQKDYVERTDMTLALEPLADIYLSPRQGRGETTSNRGKIIGALALFAALVLLTSCINFVNLSVAQLRRRGKEIGLRKTLGAKRRDIVLQFLMEALLLTVLAVFIALPLVWLAVPVYTALTGTDFTFADAANARALFMLAGFVLATGLLSGLIPALSIARLDPVVIIKGGAGTSAFRRLARSGVTVVQFGFSTVLILLALAITLQIRHLNTMDLGFNKDDLLLVQSYPKSQSMMEAMIAELGQHPGVVTVARTNRLPPDALQPFAWRPASWAPEESREVSHLMADTRYLDAMQLRLLAGRWFSADFPADFMLIGRQYESVESTSPLGVVITRAATRIFGLGTPEEALDQLLVSDDVSYRVIGVVEDFHMSGGLEDPLNSVMVITSTQALLPVMAALLLRIDPAQTDAALAHVDAVWQRHRPDLPIDRRFFRQTYSDLIEAETRGINIAAVFASVISIVISAFGLYALALYSTQQRTKEVGIRKVLGATSKKVVRLLTWDFLKPVLLACVLAAVAGYYAIQYYLQQFAARVEISPLLYLGVIAGTLLIAALTVAVQCRRAANADPVEALRYE